MSFGNKSLSMSNHVEAFLFGSFMFDDLPEPPKIPMTTAQADKLIASWREFDERLESVLGSPGRTANVGDKVVAYLWDFDCFEYGEVIADDGTISVLMNDGMVGRLTWNDSTDEYDGSVWDHNEPTRWAVTARLFEIVN
jgi:hypothetical protein